MNYNPKNPSGLPLFETELFEESLDSLGLNDYERDIAFQLHTYGFAIIDFPDDDFHGKADTITAELANEVDIIGWRESSDWREGKGLRIMDAWRDLAPVKDIAANTYIMKLLSKVYGRRAFPFQTLNFPVGSQQLLHSDAIALNSIPERFMCGVWVALEDIHEDAGPVLYYPGSHKFPIMYNEYVGRLHNQNGNREQHEYHAAWKALVNDDNIEPKYFTCKKGQALIWAANLIHGGSPHKDPDRTRWSQVTHYYFDDCIYYRTMHSNVQIGDLFLKDVIDISTEQNMPSRYMGHIVERTQDGVRLQAKLPDDFDGATYLSLHPDLQAAGMDPVSHYLGFGFHEKRRYK